MKRYIGNKEKLLCNIEDFIKESEIEVASFVDLYSGTGSVADYFRNKYEVIANDIMNYSFVVLKAKLSFESSPKFKEFTKKFEMDPIYYLNNHLSGRKNSKNNIIYNNFSPAGGRKYFTEENALRIDYARQSIDKWLDSNLISKDEWYYLLACIISTANSKGNTTGTFGAYLKEFSPSSMKTIEFKRIDTTAGKKGKVFSDDGINIVGKLKADLLYLDPPYTAIDYSQAYHFLESLSLYDSNIYTGITGRRQNNDKVSNYTKKSLASTEFENTLKRAKGMKNVLISYSTHGIIEKNEMIRIVKKYYKKVKIKEIEYSKYRNFYQNDKGDLFELLILGVDRK